MNTDPAFFDVPVDGGELRVLRWGDGPSALIAAHGITATGISWVPVVRNLPDGWTVLAPDLRGRGGSTSVGAGGTFGMARHAEDMAAVAAHAGFERVVVAGQSMGGFVAAALADRCPDLVERIVLVDGGLPLPLPLAVDDVDPDAILEMTLGPALERLRMTFASVDDYIAFWRQHPALADDWNDDLEAYVRYDLVGTEPELHSGVSEEAVRADGRDILVTSSTLGEALCRIRCPIHLVRAPFGILAQPPGVQPAELVDVWRGRIADFSDELVEDTNHYTVAFGDRGAKIVAERIADRSRAPRSR